MMTLEEAINKVQQYAPADYRSGGAAYDLTWCAQQAIQLMQAEALQQISQRLDLLTAGGE